jgi:MFS family permease
LAIARKLAPRAAPAALILDPEAATLPQSFMTPLEIFKSRHLLNTVMLWAMMTLGYISINYVSYWLPTTMLHAGASVSVAGVAISTGKLGSLAFVFLAGWLADRFGLFRFIMSNLVATGSLVVAVALIGGGPAAVVLMMLAITLDASNVSGVQAVTANAFPSELRATAFGWISGLARLVGGSIGAIVGAHLISAQWSVTSTASALAWTFFASAVLVFILRWRDRASTAGQPAPAP